MLYRLDLMTIILSVLVEMKDILNPLAELKSNIFVLIVAKLH